MRKLTMLGALAGLALATGAQAQGAREETREEAREARDATREAGRETGEAAREAGRDVRRESREAGREVRQEGREARDEVRQGSSDTRTAARGGEKKHPLFEGKNNFDVEGKISKVSKSSITVQRDGLPAATLMVSKDTKVELEGERASVAQLKQGQDVKASFNLQGDKPMAVEIKAEKRDQDSAREMQEQRRETQKEMQERRQEAQQPKRY